MNTSQIPEAQVHFDLRRQKWIPVVRSDGTRAELGLEETLAQAHLWRAISDPLPTIEFGLHRLLVAFVLDIFKPRDSYNWNELWEEGAFDAGKIKRYFEQVEAEHPGAFDLFGVRPFLQNAGMDAEKSKPLAGLINSFPSGINAIHFHHAHEKDIRVSPAVAACFLTTIAPFMVAGGPGLNPSINGAPPLYVLPLGNTVFETLLLNCPVFPDLLVCGGNIPVQWRQTEVAKVGEQTSSSLLQALTWRPRRIQLIPDLQGGICTLTSKKCDVLVGQMKFLPCWSTRFDWVDPNAAYRLGDERTVMRLREGRELWRDTGPLALLRGKGDQKFQRPALVSQIGELGQSQLFDATKPLEMAIYGLRTDMKMKVFEWQAQRLSVPMPLLWEELGQTRAQEAMDLAEKVAYALKRAVKVAYPREAQGNDRGFDAIANGATSLFWRELRPHYDDYLRFLAANPDEIAGNEGFGQWRRTLRDEAWKALKFAIDDLDGDAKALKRQTLAYAQFGSAIFRLVEPQKAEEAKAKRAKSKVSIP